MSSRRGRRGEGGARSASSGRWICAFRARLVWAAGARVVGATIIGPSSPTSSPDGNSRSRPPTPRPNSSTKRRPRWRVTERAGSSANASDAWRDWHRDRAAEWDRVRQIRRSEIAAITHRFNARLRARRAQFRAWRLETKTGALRASGGGERWRRSPSASPSGRRREDDALRAGVSRLAPILSRVGEGTARRGGARSRARAPRATARARQVPSRALPRVAAADVDQSRRIEPSRLVWKLVHKNLGDTRRGCSTGGVERGRGGRCGGGARLSRRNARGV